MSNVFNRKELKYRITDAQKLALCKGLEGLIVPDAYFDYRVYTIYLDTPDLALMRASQNVTGYKEKVRVRSYLPVCDANVPVYLEVKKKIEGVCAKRRKKTTLEQIESRLAFRGQDICSKDLERIACQYPLQPAFFLSAHRNCYVWKDDPSLRITFDDHLLYRTTVLSLNLDERADKPLLDKGQGILEIKAAGNLPLVLVRLLASLHLQPASFSKAGAVYRKLKEEGILEHGLEHNSQCAEPGAWRAGSRSAERLDCPDRLAPFQTDDRHDGCAAAPCLYGAADH